MGVGLTIGALLAGICTQYYDPFLCFHVGAFLTFLITFTGFMLTDEVETNKYALMLSDEDRMYLEEEEGITDLANQTA